MKNSKTNFFWETFIWTDSSIHMRIAKNCILQKINFIYQLQLNENEY